MIEDYLKPREIFVLGFIRNHPGTNLGPIVDAWFDEHRSEYDRYKSAPRSMALSHINNTISSMLHYSYIRREGRRGFYTYYADDD